MSNLYIMQQTYSQLNSSPSKFMYSFPKQERFKNRIKQVCQQSYYEKPSTLSTRKAGIGYSTKYDFTKLSPLTPPPNAYEKKGFIETNISKGRGWVFGNSREQQKSLGTLPNFNSKTPGPGNYNIESTISKKGWSIRQKLKSSEEKKTNIFSPGPGTYQYVPTLNNTGRYVLSKFTNSKACTFNPASSQRFEASSLSKIPGPGYYENLSSINLTGKHFYSKFESSKCGIIGRQHRQLINCNSITPGPGSYRLPSDFGYLDLQSRFISQKK